MTLETVVEIELRLPSMLHGKKRFDKINYACKNVLNAPVTWLFCDLGTAGRTSILKLRLTQIDS
jgi:ribonuclease P/MRP protein subunit RPP40